MFSGYQFAGLEYGAECHCGNRISSPRAPEEDCSLVCRGERGSPCGGVGRLSIYKVEEQLPGHRKCESASTGCSCDSVHIALLTETSTNMTDLSVMTSNEIEKVELCFSRKRIFSLKCKT